MATWVGQAQEPTVTCRVPRPEAVVWDRTSFGPRVVAFSGGGPLLVPRVAEVARWLSDAGISTAVRRQLPERSRRGVTARP